MSGIELWQESTAPAQPVLVEAGQDWQLPAYSATHTVRGRVQQVYTRSLTAKRYELKDHLGNVRVVVSDHKQARLQGNQVILSALLEGYSNYYPFGMMEPGGSYQAATASAYRYGYNGKEKDPEFQNNYEYGFRIYNPNIAKFLSVDPLTKSYPMLTPYQFASNTPIVAIDLDGLEGTTYLEVTSKDGKETVLRRVIELDIFVGVTRNKKNADGYFTKDDVKFVENFKENLDKEFNRGDFTDGTGNKVVFRFNIQTFDVDKVSPEQKRDEIKKSSEIFIDGQPKGFKGVVMIQENLGDFKDISEGDLQEGGFYSISR